MPEAKKTKAKKGEVQHEAGGDVASPTVSKAPLTEKVLNEPFDCADCKKSLIGGSYIMRGSNPYCIECYEKNHANKCHKCENVIGANMKDLSYKKLHWHSDCFTCKVCSKSLEDKGFGLDDKEEVYCSDCYQETFGQRCVQCSNVLKQGQRKVDYKGKTWHDHCFQCGNCEKQLGNQSFVPHEDGNRYCVPCYEELFGTKCTACSKVISGTGVSYKDEPYHRECFTCTHCKAILAGQKFTSVEEKPYCAECYAELFAKRCTSCKKAITGIGGFKYVAYEERNWHGDCFVCGRCGSNMVGHGFVWGERENEILCPECGRG